MNYKSSSVKELLVYLKEGSQGAFTEIYNRYWKHMLAIAYTFSNDKSVSQDIVQEIFAKLWARQAELNIEYLNTYLGSAVRFSVFKLIYKKKRRLQIESQNVLEELSTLTEEQIDTRFIQEYINKVVEDLPENCRMVFNYSRKSGLSTTEISMELGISKKTVEGYLTKGLKIIRLNLRNAMNLFLF
ncbi:MAG: sigma-70 family RNA polymerase sigma factor [Phormidesmis sp. FL-bin-119]|nr:sigma-70 family RNA polymerase sigma factor [Pedobacter sp.]